MSLYCRIYGGDDMTKKDYIKVAEILKKARGQEIKEDRLYTIKAGTINYIGNDLCRLFAEDNPRFSPDKFWSAVNG